MEVLPLYGHDPVQTEYKVQSLLVAIVMIPWYRASRDTKEHTDLLSDQVIYLANNDDLPVETEGETE